MLFQYIIDMDNREFIFKLNNMENIANYILELQRVKKIKKLWAH